MENTLQQNSIDYLEVRVKLILSDLMDWPCPSKLKLKFRNPTKFILYFGPQYDLYAKWRTEKWLKVKMAHIKWRKGKMA